MEKVILLHGHRLRGGGILVPYTEVPTLKVSIEYCVQ